MDHRVKIKMERHGQGSVWLDGVELKGVTAFSISAGARQLNKLNIQLEVDQIEIEGPARLTDEPQC